MCGEVSTAKGSVLGSWGGEAAGTAQQPGEGAGGCERLQTKQPVGTLPEK